MTNKTCCEKNILTELFRSSLSTQKEIIRKMVEGKRKNNPHDDTHAKKGICLICWEDTGWNLALDDILSSLQIIKHKFYDEFITEQNYI